MVDTSSIINPEETLSHSTLPEHHLTDNKEDAEGIEDAQIEISTERNSPTAKGRPIVTEKKELSDASASEPEADDDTEIMISKMPPPAMKRYIRQRILARRERLQEQRSSSLSPPHNLSTLAHASTKKGMKKNTKQYIGKGKWNVSDHKAFLSAYAAHGRKWTKIRQMVPTKSISQIRVHATECYLSKDPDVVDVASIMRSLAKE